MCGIAGFIHFERDNGRPEWAAIAHSMGETLHHRGPDDRGEWTCPAGALVHRRLAGIDPTQYKNTKFTDVAATASADDARAAEVVADAEVIEANEAGELDAELEQAAAEAVASAIEESEELAAAKQRMTELEDQLFSLRAQALTDRGDLLLLEPPTRPDGARKLADAAAKASGGLAAVFAGAESSYVYALVQADGADISPLVKRLNAALSGRGGGRNGFAQGSVQADRTAIYDFFRKEGIECPTC